MIRTVFIPITKTMSQTDTFFLQSKGKLDAYVDNLVKEREKAEQELNTLLESGWNSLHASAVQDNSGIDFAFVLYKADHPDVFEDFFTTEDADPS